MIKSIKIIDLLNKIANGEEVPKKIKQKYLEGNSFEDLIDNIKYFNADFSKTLNEEIEIIEEQEPEIDIQSYKELLLNQLREREHTNADIYMLGIQINALIRAVKQIDNQIKKGDEVR